MAGAYSKELRACALDRVAGGETAASVAQDLGISESTIRRWCKASARQPTGHHKGGTPSEPPEWAVDFLEALAGTCNVTRACEKAGVSRSAVYEARDAIPAFAEAWNRAKRIGADVLEDEAVRRAQEGWEEPVFYQGVMMDTVRKYSDTLLIFLLKGAKPEKYRERVEHTGKDGEPLFKVYRGFPVEDV